MRVALLGTGLMGHPMAERLLTAGYAVTVYNRTQSKAGPLADKGAEVAVTAGGAIDAAECVLLMLSDAAAIEHVLFGERVADLAGKTVIQMGTIAPVESVALARQVANCGGEYFECPVLGSRNEAAGGQLILMAGATQKQFERWQPLLRVFGPQPRLVGEVGQAAALKLALNQLIASHAAGFCLSLGIVEKNAVPIETFMDILENSALNTAMYGKKLPNWLERKYENPNFPLKHLLKDVRLIVKESKEKGLSTDAVSGIRTVLEKAMDRGLGEMDYSALFEEIRKP